MPRGKNTNVYLICQVCKNQNYTTRINERTIDGKLELEKFCKKCKEYTSHKSGKKITHSNGK